MAEYFLTNEKFLALVWTPRITGCVSAISSLLTITTISRSSQSTNIIGYDRNMLSCCCKKKSSNNNNCNNNNNNNETNNGNSSSSSHHRHRQRQHRQSSTLSSSSRRQQRQQGTYHRIVLAMSFYDLIFSVGWAVGQAAVPTETGLTYAYGNQQSCTTIGFCMQFGIGAFLYSAALTIYYVLTIKYNVRQTTLATYFEPTCHLSIFLWSFITAIVAIPFDFYYTLGGPTCWFNAKPLFCEIYPHIQCDAGEKAKLYSIIVSVIPLFITTIVVIICLTIVTITVIQTRNRIQDRILDNVHASGAFTATPTTTPIITTTATARTPAERSYTSSCYSSTMATHDISSREQQEELQSTEQQQEEPPPQPQLEPLPPPPQQQQKTATTTETNDETIQESSHQQDGEEDNEENNIDDEESPIVPETPHQHQHQQEETTQQHQQQLEEDSSTQKVSFWRRQLSSSSLSLRQQQQQRSATTSRRSSTSTAVAIDLQTSLVKSQCLLYGITFFNVNFWVTFISILEIMGRDEELLTNLYWALYMFYFFFPLQGFFNHIIYIRPRFLSTKRANPTRSFIWCYWVTLWNL